MARPACTEPIAKGPNRGQVATGSPAGYYRHRRRNEPACDACRAAANEDRRAWKRANPEKVAAMDRAYRDANADAIRARQRRWYRENRERLLEQGRQWVEANRDRVAANQRRWQEDNLDKVRAKQRRYRERHADELRERRRQWQRANPDRTSEYGRRWSEANREKVAEKSRRRRATKAAVLTVPFTVDQLADRMAFWGNRCWMCGGPYEAVDHVIPLAAGGPHCLANCRPACKSCNSSKGARDWAEVVGKAN